MNFAEQPPSNQWANLKYRGDKFAEVWFKPEGKPLALIFRIPQTSFQIPGMGSLLTMDNLLKAVGINTEEVESWNLEGASPSGTIETNSERTHPLPPPDVSHLTITVSMKPQPRTDTAPESGESEILVMKWQDLVARWKVILGLEMTIDNLRLRMEGLRSEMEASARKTLATEEKLHALNSDVAQWNKAKSRVHYSVPKVKEFIHRATWATGAPERKKLEEVFEDYVHPSISLAQMDKVREQMESLLKDRQVLSAQGVAVYQECQSLSSEIQGLLRTLQSNAASNARKQREADRKKGKFV